MLAHDVCTQLRRCNCAASPGPRLPLCTSVVLAPARRCQPAPSRGTLCRASPSDKEDLPSSANSSDGTGSSGPPATTGQAPQEPVPAEPVTSADAEPKLNVEGILRDSWDEVKADMLKQLPPDQQEMLLDLEVDDILDPSRYSSRPVTARQVELNASQ